MKIGLIDVDGHNYPNLALMKISAFHKAKGDSVEWYIPLASGHLDRVYMSKIFTFTQDYEWAIDADEIVKGGTGYFYPDGGAPLECEIEHAFPDYSLYPKFKDTAFGFLTRGCPRKCEFCIVSKKEGCKSYKVANLSEFWNSQKYIELLDPNLLACKEHKELLYQLANSKSYVNFTQGLDARLLNKKNIDIIKNIKVKAVHFAWDNVKDERYIVPKLQLFKEKTGWSRRKMSVYVLTNFNSTHEEDLHRIYTLKKLGYNPYIMIYEKEKLSQGHITKRLQRWVNSRRIFETVRRFEDYE